MPALSARTRLQIRKMLTHYRIEGTFAGDFLSRVTLWPASKPILQQGSYKVPKEELIGLIEGVRDFDVEWDNESAADREMLLAARGRRLQMSKALYPKQNIGLDVLRPYQHAGVEYALDVLSDGKGVMIADAPGSGKSIIALAAVEHLNAYPCLVLTPAGLRPNWRAEIIGGYGKPGWLKHRSVDLPATGSACKIRGSDFTIISMDTWWRLPPGKKERHWGSVIIDEAHMLRNPTSQRSQAVKKLIPWVNNGRVLLLTGTPIVNKFTEAAPQLSYMRRLSELGGARRFAVLDMRGAETVHTELRKTCYLRRTQEEVLPQLPKKHRDVIPIEVDMGKYVEEETGLKQYLVEHPELHFEDMGKVSGSLMTMRRLVGEAKVQWCVDWADNWLTSSNGDCLVVFTHHKNVQEDIIAGLDKWGVAAIRGGDEAEKRMKAVESLGSFGEGGNKVLIAATLAAGVGLDIIKPNTALMAELQWTPMALDQAECRLARLGQKRAVTIVYPLAENTIDSRIWSILNTKSLVTSSLTDGKAVQFQVSKLLVEDLRKEATKEAALR